MKKLLLSTLVFVFAAISVFAQVTTGSMSGVVADAQGESLPGATVLAVHNPSGTRYVTVTKADGRFTIPGMRVGGPYSVTVKFVGFKDQVTNNLSITLGNATAVNSKLVSSSTQLSEVTITAAGKNDLISSDRTGAATNVGRDVLQVLPTIGRTINDFTRLTPQANGSSFGGQDNRMNNITIDGSLFNNSFGLAGQPGGRTGVAPISLDAIDQVQVNIAPFDVRQSGFVGASVNAVTKSGTNQFSGTGFYILQSESFLGNKAKDITVTKQPYDTKQYGFSLGGPIIKNKLFFFVNAEKQQNSTPASSFRARKAGETATGTISRVYEDDLATVSTLLGDLGYSTGIYQDYNFETKGDRFLTRLDWNINDKNKFSIRYNYLNSTDDKPVSNSSSLGYGNRFNSSTAMSFINSNYLQTEKVHSVVAELNSTFGTKWSNNLIAGYSFQNEDRGSSGELFPLIEIQDAGTGTTYITAGSEPFTPNNKLKYSTYQFQNNLTYYGDKHTLTGGVSLERLAFENVFFPGSQSVYVFGSLADFQKGVAQFKSNPNATTSANVDPLLNYSLKRFQLRFSALPGGAEPVQPTKVWYAGAYAQDEIQVNDNFKLSAGFRVDVPYFENTGYSNPNVKNLLFKRSSGQNVQVTTDELPGAKPLFSPRVGFNWDAKGDKSLQIRGGSGLFSGRPAFVWISNQIGNNGVLTGFEDILNTNTRPFKTSPSAYIPANPSAGLPTTYEINVTDPNFKFPQVWKTNIAIDKKLMWGLIGTAEFIYSKDYNAVKYENINLELPTQTFAGSDNRPRFPGYGLTSTAFNNASRINDNITSALFLTNADKGYGYQATFAIERPYSKGLYFKAAYTYGQSKNLVNAGSVASGSYTGNPVVGNPGSPDLAYSNDDLRHRAIAAVSYKKSYKYGSTAISLFYEARNQGNYNFIYSADFDGDGNRNDLIYIPKNANDIIFVNRTVGSGASAVTYTPDQQKILFENFINQDKYLRENRGKYAERNGGLLPWVFRADASIVQEFKVKVANQNNVLQFRLDVFNVGNLLNKDWGVGRFVRNNQILTPAGVNGAGQPQFTYNNFIGTAPATATFAQSGLLGVDTYRAQFGVRYIFN